jgi:beta-glucosidase-like glycosyl hydrolase
MKAIAATMSIPEAAVRAIAAGCDGVLVCRAGSSGPVQDAELQAMVLEALVHAVEDGRIPQTRAEDALARNRVAKERFLAAPVTPGRPSTLRQVLGSDEHRRIADEMARYV